MAKEKVTKTIGKAEVAREDLLYALHVALRKACDSRPTSLAWNLINLDALNEAMNSYLDEAWKRLVKAKPDDFAIACKDAIEDGLPWGTTSAHVSLRIAFEMFDDNDWEGFVSFLDIK